jgi:hypothetical protein
LYIAVACYTIVYQQSISNLKTNTSPVIYVCPNGVLVHRFLNTLPIMIPAPPPISVPESYTNLPTKHITVSHYPASSPVATPVIVVTLNRPKQRNAFTIQMMHDFELCYPIFDVDERVKCIVLTGAGKTFCAGADLEIGFNSVGTAEGEERVTNKDRRDT